MATDATAAATAAPTPTTPPKITSVPKDVRQRILSGGKPPSPDELAEKAKLEAAAAEKKKADDKAAADKKAEEERAAAEAKEKKKFKAPKLPDPPPIELEKKKTIEETVREILPEITGQSNKGPLAPKLSP